MRNSFLFLMQLVGTVAIAQNSAFSNRTIQLDGITTVHIVRQSAAGKMHVGARLYHSFPAYDFHQLEDSLAPGDTEHWFQCPVRSVLEGSVLIGQTELRLIMIPGDTIHVYATPIDSTENPKMTFLLAGKTKAVQAYCLAKEKQFPEDPDENSMNIGGSTRTLGDFQHRIDSNYAIQRTFWQQYRRENQLPAWFIRYETNAMQYCDARLRLYMIAYRQFVNKTKEPIPGDYFAFLDKLPIRNDEARYDYYYLRFLEQYLHWKAKQNMRSTDYDVTQTTEFKLANPLLGHETGDFFDSGR